MKLTFDRKKILNDFLVRHGDHYSLREPLGEGGFGFTYRAHDERRHIDVCLKLFLDGTAPVGARRDWRITSTLKHSLIGDTFTVEHFELQELGEPCVAVVSRFIAGRNLGNVIDRFRELPAEQQSGLVDDYVRDIGNDICTAIRACHDQGYGHGDLSEYNVMIDSSGRFPEKRFTAVVIDFDNATYKPELRDLEETKLIEKDVRSLARLIGMLTLETRWHEQLQNILKYCETSRHVQDAFQFTLEIARRVNGDASEEYGEPHWSKIQRTLLAISMMGGPYLEAIHKFIERVADDVGQRAALEGAKAALLHRIETDPGYPEISLTMELRHAAIEAAARSLVD